MVSNEQSYTLHVIDIYIWQLNMKKKINRNAFLGPQNSETKYSRIFLGGQGMQTCLQY